jgi:WD40 repeat protein/serine/threonine protein kinase
MPDSALTTPDDRFDKVLAAILLEEEGGTPVDLSRIVRKYPDLAAPLREFFRNRDGFDRLAPHLAPTASDRSTPPPPELAPGSQLGGYDIIRELGRGGMGIVYLARQRSAKRPVALKLIRMDRLAHLSSRQRKEWMSRFRTERQTAARITDERVVTVYEVGEWDGRPFFSMRYVPGRSLAEVIETGPLKNRPAAILMEKVARAVEAIHEQNVLHRDLKPRNILVDAKGRPFVSDFGVAKFLDAGESLTDTGEMLGSPQYMSPEQAQDAARVSKATDVYGLGATLYTLVTGKPPFRGNTLAEILHQVKYREPVPPRRLNPAVDRDLNTIILKCLEKEPERRFHSAADVADELRRYIDGRPLRTRPLGPAGTLWRWCRRKPVLAGLSAAAAVLLVVAGTATVLLGLKTTQVDTLAEAVSQANAGKQQQEAVADTERTERKKKEREAGEEKLKREIEETRRVKEEENAAQEQAQREALTYLNDMGQAGRLIDGGDFNQARQILQRYLPPKKPDRRAWSWHFLAARCRDAGFPVLGDKGKVPALGSQTGFNQRGHGGQVQAVAWSPDGKRLASADGLGIVKVWRVADGQELFHWQIKGGVAALQWSPDGKKLTAATQGMGQPGGGALPFPATPASALPPNVQRRPAQPGSLPVIQARQQAPTRRGPRDGKSPAAESHGIVQIWDVDTGKSLRTLHQAANFNSSSAMPLPVNAGQEAIAAASSRNIFLGSWSASLLWSPGNRKLALGDEDGKIQVWDLSTNKKDPLCLPAHLGGVHSAAWSPKGDRLASVSGDALIKIWDTISNKPIFTVPLLPPANGFGPTRSYALTWTPDGKCLNVISNAGEIRVVDVAPRTVGDARKLVPSDPLIGLGVGLLGSRNERFVWSPDSTLLASVQTGGEVKIWDVATGKEGASMVIPGAAGAMLTAGSCCPAWDRTGQRLALGGSDGTVLAWVLGARRQAVRRLLVANALGWSADSGHIIGTVGWSLENDEKVKAAREQMGEAMQALKQAAARNRISAPDPRAILGPRRQGPLGAAAGKPQPQVKVYDARNGAVIRTLGNGVQLDVLAASPDGKWLAAATNAGLLQLLPAAGGDGITLERPPAPGAANGPAPTNRVVLCWSPDSTRLAFSTHVEATIHVWDPVTRKKVQTFKGHGEPLRSLAWSPDGKRLASAGDDGMVRIWDVFMAEETAHFKFYVKQQPGHNQVHPRASSMLSWCPDGKRLAVAGEDEVVTIWDVDTKTELAPLHGHPSPKDIHDEVCAVAWNPDGKHVASTSPDGTFLLWDTVTWKEVLVLHAPSTGSFKRYQDMPGFGGTLAWSADGWQLGYFSGGQSVAIWDATTGVSACAKSLQAAKWHRWQRF